MAWSGHKQAKASSSEVSIQPNIKQFGNNISNEFSNKIQNRDNGKTIHENDQVGDIPHVATHKRVHDIRRDLDTQKNWAITLYDIDSTIFEYIDKRLDLHIIDNGSNVKVPILWASPEKWVSIKKYGYIRDNQGKIMCPACLIRRTNVTNDIQFGTFNRYLEKEFAWNIYNEKNKYDRFDLLNNSLENKPVRQIFVSKIPDYIKLSYDIILWTDTLSQNNKLVEILNFSTHDYWGLDRIRLRTEIPEYTHEVDSGSGTDRKVQSKCTLLVHGYLLNETIDSMQNTTQAKLTLRKIKFNIVSESQFNQRTSN